MSPLESFAVNAFHRSPPSTKTPAGALSIQGAALAASLLEGEWPHMPAFSRRTYLQEIQAPRKLFAPESSWEFCHASSVSGRGNRVLLRNLESRVPRALSFRFRSEPQVRLRAIPMKRIPAAEVSPVQLHLASSRRCFCNPTLGGRKCEFQVSFIAPGH